jgi:hypothetical protein
LRAAEPELCYFGRYFARRNLDFGRGSGEADIDGFPTRIPDSNGSAQSNFFTQLEFETDSLW